MNDDLDKAIGQSAPTAFSSTSVFGERHGGTIVGSPAVRQIRKFKNGKPTDELDTWDNGDAKNQIHVIVATDEHSDGDDDGRRSLYIKTWGPQKEALVAAVKAAGYAKLSEALVEGNQLFGTYVKDDFERGTATTPAKIFGYEIKRASSGALDAAVAQPEPAAAAQANANEKANKARQMISLGLDDETIAKALDVAPSTVAALRSTVVAGEDVAPF